MSKNYRRRRSASEWSSIISDFHESGLSTQAFCNRAGIALSTFSKWRQRQGDEATSTPTRFVAVNGVAPVDQTPSSSGWDLELDLGDGMTLRLRRQG